MRSIGSFADFEFYMAVLGVGRGPTGLVAALRFKMLDSQPRESNMGPVQADVHEICNFQKNCHETMKSTETDSYGSK